MGIAIYLLLLSIAMAPSALAANWDAVAWGMSSPEIAALYGARATRLAHPIVFGDSYVDVVLQDYPFAGYPFRVYFQMESGTGRLAHVLLERRRQYASPEIFRAVVARLREQLGEETVNCSNPADRGRPTAIDRIWIRPDETVMASYLDFASEVLEFSNDPARRILIRYSQKDTEQPSCARR